MLQKRSMWLCKSYSKKKRKMDKCPRIEKEEQKLPTEKTKKEEKNKIAHVLLQKSLSFKKRYVFKEHSRIRISQHIYIPHIFHTHAYLDLPV
jgi:hypothetical protein